MKPKILINGLIISNGFRFVGCITIEDGLITAVNAGRVDPADISPLEYDIYDCSGKIVMPGVIDEHVHFRDPGMTEKGDIRTESRAALAGGVTSFFDMPNTTPQTTSIEAWENKMAKAAEASAINYAFFLGATGHNTDELLRADYTRVPGVKLFMGSSTGGMLMDNDSEIARLFSSFPHVIAVHAESEHIIRANIEAYKARYPQGVPVGLHSAIRSREACVEATTRAINLARRTGARLHVMHVTTADELALLTPGCLPGKRITAETCPHYLYFTEESVESTGGLTKCNPAIKTDADRRALLRAVAEGRIDVIATDHAPHLLAQKQGDALTASSGMPSVQFSLPLMMQLARKGHFTLEDVVEKMSTAPALLYNISRRGMIHERYMADIVVVDPDADYILEDSQVISTCGWTPYRGTRLNFRVEQTWVNGELAYDRGTFTDRQTPLAVRFDI